MAVGGSAMRLLARRGRAALALVTAALATASMARAALRYPESRKADVVDDYHGVKIADPYRWLEELNSDEARAWTAAQNAVTFGMLEKVPQREVLRKRLP